MIKDKKIIWVIGIALILIFTQVGKKTAMAEEHYTIGGLDFKVLRTIAYSTPGDTGGASVTATSNSLNGNFYGTWDGGGSGGGSITSSFIIPEKLDSMDFLFTFDASGSRSSGGASININGVNFLTHSTWHSLSTNWKPPLSRPITIKKAADGLYYYISADDVILIGDGSDPTGKEVSISGSVQTDVDSVNGNMAITGFTITYLLCDADTNCDGAVTDTELLTYADLWLSNQITDIELLQAANLWLNPLPLLDPTKTCNVDSDCTFNTCCAAGSDSCVNTANAPGPCPPLCIMSDPGFACGGVGGCGDNQCIEVYG